MLVLSRFILLLFLSVGSAAVPMFTPAAAQSVETVGTTLAARNGDLPPAIAYHLAKLVEGHRNYTAHSKSLTRLEIARATEEVDTAIAEQMCSVLEKDAQMLQEHALALQAIAPAGLQRWLEPLAEHAEDARGTAMAIRSLLAPDAPLDAKREALAVTRKLHRRANEMGLLLGGVKQDLRVTTT